MPRLKKQHLKRRKDGRFCCKYNGIQFMGNTEEEALSLREEYKQKVVCKTVCKLKNRKKIRNKKSPLKRYSSRGFVLWLR